MISHIVCYRTDLFWSGSEGQLTAQKVTRCSHTPWLAGKATGNGLCWLMSLEHFLCLLVSWIFHKFRIKKAVLHSGQLTCQLTLPWEKHFFLLTFSSTSIPGANRKTQASKYRAYMLHLIMRVPTRAVSCCWTVSGWSSEINKKKMNCFIFSNWLLLLWLTVPFIWCCQEPDIKDGMI